MGQLAGGTADAVIGAAVELHLDAVGSMQARAIAAASPRQNSICGGVSCRGMLAADAGDLQRAPGPAMAAVWASGSAGCACSQARAAAEASRATVASGVSGSGRSITPSMTSVRTTDCSGVRESDHGGGSASPTFAWATHSMSSRSRTEIGGGSLGARSVGRWGSGPPRRRMAEALVERDLHSQRGRTDGRRPHMPCSNSTKSPATCSSGGSSAVARSSPAPCASATRRAATARARRRRAAGRSYLVKQGVVADSAHTLANEAALYRRLSAGPRALRAASRSCTATTGPAACSSSSGSRAGRISSGSSRRAAAARPRWRRRSAARSRRCTPSRRTTEELRRDAPWVLALHRPPLEALRYFSAASTQLVTRLRPTGRCACDGRAARGLGAAGARASRREMGQLHRPPGAGRVDAAADAGQARRLGDGRLGRSGVRRRLGVQRLAARFGGAGGPGPAATAALWASLLRAAHGSTRAARRRCSTRAVRFAGARLVQSAYEHRRR